MPESDKRITLEDLSPPRGRPTTLGAPTVGFEYIGSTTGAGPTAEPIRGRAQLLSPAARPANLATTAVSFSGSTGLVRCS